MVLDMGGQVRILDLANQLIALLSPATRVVFTGLRPAEKRHEVVVASDEIGCVRAHPRISRVRPAPTDPAMAMAGSSFERVKIDTPAKARALT
jgi:FlaA1/EpsC-like NDP-sugar epimerase